MIDHEKRTTLLNMILKTSAMAAESREFLQPFTEEASNLPLGMRLNFVQAETTLDLQSHMIQQLNETLMDVEDQLHKLIDKYDLK